MADYSWNTSYVFANDTSSGWGERYFFTYFTEFDGRPLNYVAIEAAIFLAIFIISVIANTSIIICVIRFPDMRTVTNCFVLNLAAADLLFAATIPAVAYTRIVSSWKLGDFACKFIPYMEFVSGIVLLWTLALISIDRHRCIVVPPYRSKITPSQASISSLAIWISTAIIFTPVPLWFRVIPLENNLKICTLVFPQSSNIHFSACFIMPVIFFACLLPMVLLVYHYQRIFHKIISTKNTWASSCVMVSAMEVKDCRQGRRQSELSISDIFVPWPRRFSTQMVSPNGRQGSLSQHEELRLNKHIKVVRVLFLNVVVVLVMWLPITLVMLLIYIDGSRANDDRGFFLRSHHFIAALIVAFLNTLVNPVVYGVLSDNFRACLVRMWCRVSDEEKEQTSSGRVVNATKTTRKQSFINSVSEN
ncbi:somatostatin-like receptor F_48D10.1 [Tribolium castaneum]|nr:PREDICTED: somatostatin-like receptor F_48D10.1 [Tribolium castaneum]|eukprot:XP_008199874.1 PREDICTED: somatostatin-like receptor F_48D10.1 [Tribolium castaneum]